VVVAVTEVVVAAGEAEVVVVVGTEEATEEAAPTVTRGVETRDGNHRRFPSRTCFPCIEPSTWTFVATPFASHHHV
jgi:hypothetical protein